MRELEDIKIKDLNIPESALTCSPEATLREMIDQMQGAHIGSLVVTSGSQVEGIITERDVLMKIVGKGLDLDAEKVKDFMTPDPFTIAGDEPLASALLKMRMGGFRHLVVQGGGAQQPTVVSARDITDFFIEHHLGDEAEGAS